MLPMVPDIAGLVLARSPAHEIRRKADSLGMGTLFGDGMRKAAKGITTEQEVRRVTAV
jgi:type II secretory ATPase GspE/PulE/Tfp pilus assembly ATPase PilB-like protein